MAVGSRFIVPFLGADVVKLAGLQQACISEVLLIGGILRFVSNFYMTGSFGSHVVLWSSLVFGVGRGQEKVGGLCPTNMKSLKSPNVLGTLCLLSALGQKATPALGTCLAIASRDAFGFLTISMAQQSVGDEQTHPASTPTLATNPTFYGDLSNHAEPKRVLISIVVTTWQRSFC
jgi:hypothetical protein